MWEAVGARWPWGVCWSGGAPGHPWACLVLRLRVGGQGLQSPPRFCGAQGIWQQAVPTGLYYKVGMTAFLGTGGV